MDLYTTANNYTSRHEMLIYSHKLSTLMTGGHMVAIHNAPHLSFSKTRKTRTNVCVWIQLAEPQCICISGSQVQQLTTTIPQFIWSWSETLRSPAQWWLHSETSELVPRIGGAGVYPGLNLTPIKLFLNNCDTVAGQIRTPILQQALLSHFLAKSFHSVRNSIIAPTCKQERITIRWWWKTNGGGGEPAQRGRNVAAIWNLGDEVNFRSRKTNHKLIFFVCIWKKVNCGCFWWRFHADASERFRELTHNSVGLRGTALGCNGLGDSCRVWALLRSRCCVRGGLPLRANMLFGRDAEAALVVAKQRI